MRRVRTLKVMALTFMPILLLTACAQSPVKSQSVISQSDVTSLSITPVEKLTDVRIDNFVVVDFKAFKTVVDAIGGVEVCLTTPAYDPVIPLIMEPMKSCCRSMRLKSLPSPKDSRARTNAKACSPEIVL